MTHNHHPCPGCPTGRRTPGKYLCFDCWGELPLPARRALQRTDVRAMARLQELYGQINAGIPLSDINVSP